MPNFEEIWPSKKKKDGPRRGEGNLDYYLDAMENGPKLSGEKASFFKGILDVS